MVGVCLVEFLPKLTSFFSGTNSFCLRMILKVFFFTKIRDLEPSDYLFIEIFEKSGNSSKSIGYAPISQVQTIHPHDEAVDMWCTLQPKLGKSAGTQNRRSYGILFC